MIRRKKEKRKKVKKVLGFGSRSSPSTNPHLHSTQMHTPLCLRNTFPGSTPPPPSPDGGPPHPPRQSGPGSSHLPCQHPPPSGTRLPLSFGTAITPPRLSGRNFLGNQKQRPTKPRPGSSPLPSRTPNHNRRRGVHPLHSQRRRLWHSGHHDPTRYC